jgi:hypothetical protein
MENPEKVFDLRYKAGRNPKNDFQKGAIIEGGKMKRQNRSFYACSVCHQDMRERYHRGANGKDCPACGQGLSWRKRKPIDANRNTQKKRFSHRQTKEKE